MLNVKQISKSFASAVPAVEQLSFKISKGERVALLGPNGAGKSTTFKLILGLIVADTGEITLEGIKMNQSLNILRKKMGYLPEKAPLYPELTPLDHLRWLARIYQLRDVNKRVSDLMAVCELEEVANKRIGILSRGYQQRVALAGAIIHEPSFLVLDEPTSGLDPQQIEHFKQLVLKTGKERALLLSSHVLSEVESVCDRCLILNKGRLVNDIQLPMVRNQNWVIIWKGNWPNDHHTFKVHHKGGCQGEWNKSEISFFSEESPDKVLSMLIQQGVQIREYHAKSFDLEAFFLQSTSN